MKKALKIFGVIFALALIICSFTVLAFADGADNGASQPVYELYLNGEFVKNGFTAEDFVTDLQESVGTARIKLLADLNLEENRIRIERESNAAIKLEIDLAGNRMLFSGKSDTAAIMPVRNATVDLFSSKPGGVISCTELRSGSYVGDPMFSVSSASSAFNIGEFTEEDGTVYSGDNLTASAISLISAAGAEGSRINVVGGTYIRVPTGDHRAFIMQGSGATTIHIKGAVVLANSGSMFRMQADKGQVILESSLIAGYGSSTPGLVNTGMTGASKNSFFGELTLKDSTVLVNLSVPEHEGDDPENYTRSGTLIIKGANAFEETSLTLLAVQGMSGIDGCVTARISRGYAERFSSESAYFLKNPDTGEYYSVPVKIHPAAKFSTIVPESDVTECIISNGIISTSENWYTGIEVQPDLDIPIAPIEGVFTVGWSYTVASNGSRTYKPAFAPDFKIKASYSYDGGIKTNVYIPAVFVDEYMDDLYSAFNGKAIRRERFSEATIDGVKYYKLVFDGVDNLEVNLAGVIDDKNGFEFNATVSLIHYAEAILETDISDNVRTAVYDLCQSAICILSNKEGGEELIAGLLPVVEGQQLTSARTDIYEKLSLTPETDGSYLAELDFGIGYDTFGNLKITIPEAFYGKLEIVSGDYLNSYSISNGKTDGKSEISLLRKFDQIYDGVEIRIYGEDGKLIAKDGASYTATYSLAEAYSKMTESEAVQLKANLALYYSIAKIGA